MSAWGWRSGDQAQANLEQSSTSAAENIDEAPPSIDQPSEADVASYTVSSNLPRYLIIDSLGVKARVQTLGLTKSGAVQAPANVYDAGWYRGSSVPGSGSGAAFIDGHVSSWETDGVFKELSRLKAGDTVKVELGDGTMVTYKVVKTEISSVESVDMAAALAPVTPGKPGLNLMTCHGGVRSGTNEFAERFTVFTELI